MTPTKENNLQITPVEWKSGTGSQVLDSVATIAGLSLRVDKLNLTKFVTRVGPVHCGDYVSRADAREAAEKHATNEIRKWVWLEEDGKHLHVKEIPWWRYTGTQVRPGDVETHYGVVFGDHYCISRSGRTWTARLNQKIITDFLSSKDEAKMACQRYHEHQMLAVVRRVET